MEKVTINFKRAIGEDKILSFSDQVEKIHKMIENYEGEGSDFLGWKDLPQKISENELNKMEEVAKKLKKEGIETLVVIGIGGSYLGVKAGIDFIYGNLPSKNEINMEVIFAGESLSSFDMAQKLKYVENKKFAINVISKSGTTLEPAIAFRMFKKLLEDKVGKNVAKNYIFATTDAKKGALYNLASTEGYEKFVIPDDVGGRFSVLTPVGLLPFACIGMDIKKLIHSAKVASELYNNGDLKTNIAYQYAVCRYIMYDQKKLPVEMLVAYEPNLRFFTEWWKQLFAESEGKNNKGLLPHSAIFSTDLHSLGQLIQEGSKVLFETILTVKNPKIDLNMIEVPENENLDNLNYLVGKTLNEINEVAFQATLDAHSLVGNVPNIHIELEDLSEQTLGTIIMFFERAVAMSGYLLGINPFNQPGVEVYKTNMFKSLKKPQ